MFKIIRKFNFLGYAVNPKSPAVCVRCEEVAEEPVYQGILEVKRIEEEDIELRSLQVYRISMQG